MGTSASCVKTNQAEEYDPNTICEDDIRAFVVELRLMTKTSLWYACKDNLDEVVLLSKCMVRTAMDLKKQFRPPAIFSYGHRIFLFFFADKIGHFPYGADESKAPSVMAAFASVVFVQYLRHAFPNDDSLTTNQAVFCGDVGYFRSDKDAADYIAEKAKEGRMEYVRGVARKAQGSKRVHPYKTSTETAEALRANEFLPGWATIGFFVKSKEDMRRSFDEDGNPYLVPRTHPNIYVGSYPIDNFDHVWPDHVTGGSYVDWAKARVVDTPGDKSTFHL